MTTDLSPVVALLAEHRNCGWDYTSPDDAPRTTCGMPVPEIPTVASLWVDAHQADALAAAGLLPETTTEWGVEYVHKSTIQQFGGDGAPMTREGAEAIVAALPEAHARVMRRETYVSEWRPADEGSA